MPKLNAELFVNGAWVDVTSDLREDEGVRITRGRRDEGSGVDRGRAFLKLNNRHGKYSDGNPLSPYYGQLTRNTPIRLWVQGDESYAWMSGGQRLKTASNAALNVAGDLDVRVEMYADVIPPLNSGSEFQTTELIGRYGAAGSRMWRVTISSEGYPALFWSVDGTNMIGFVGSAPIPVMPGQRFALRCTLDVDNGAGGHTVRYYVADTLDGPWEPLGTAQVGSGTTSITTTPTVDLELGAFSADSTRWPFPGGIYRAQVRSGIDGTIVANPDIRALPQNSSASFVDSAGRTWDFHDGAKAQRYRKRFRGVVPAWPQYWNQDGSDSWVSIEAAGPLRRLDQGSRPLLSTLRQRVPAGNPKAYWPLEDGALTTAPASPIEGVTPLIVSGLNFAADSSLPGSDNLPTTTGSATLVGLVPGAVNGPWHTEFVYKLDKLPATEQTFFDVIVSGSSLYDKVRCRVSTAGIRVQVFNDGGLVTQIVSTDPNAIAAFTNNWNRLQIFTSVSGGLVYATLAWRDVITNIWYYAYTSFAGSSVGRVTSLNAAWGADFEGLAFGHVAAFDQGGTGPTSPGVTIFDRADDGFNLERALDRLRRVANEQDMYVTGNGRWTETEQMGPQRIATAMEIFRDVEASDGGTLMELREIDGLFYLPRYMQYNRRTVLTLDSSAGHLGAPLTPVRDDQNVRNEVVVTREGGASSNPARRETGPLSIDAIGLYQEELTLNLGRDSQTDPLAGWHLHLRTVNEARIPSVVINLMNPAMASMRQQILDRLEQQCVIVLRNTLYTPDDIPLVVQGYTEKLSLTEWTLELNCSPASPWAVGVLEGAGGPARVDTDGSELAGPATDTDASLMVAARVGPQWISSDVYPAEFPFDVRVGGEVCRVNTCVPAVNDEFSAASGSNWGTTDRGETWVHSGGALATDYDVTGGEARHKHSTRNLFRFSTLLTPLTDCEILTNVRCPQTVTGNSVYAFVFARANAALNSLYFARLLFTTAGNVTLSLRKRVSGAETVLATAASVSHAAANSYRVRFQVRGSALKAKMWKTTDPEPAAWGLEVTDTELAGAGSIGFRSFVDPANTNALPVVVSLENFAVTDVQAMGVTRSVNGVTKAQAERTPLSLAYPTVVAL